MQDTGDRSRSVYRIMVGVWIFVGLAWLAGVITFFQEIFMNLLQKAQTNMDGKNVRFLQEYCYVILMIKLAQT
jgi:hypothetical protein